MTFYYSHPRYFYYIHTLPTNRARRDGQKESTGQSRRQERRREQKRGKGCAYNVNELQTLRTRESNSRARAETSETKKGELEMPKVPSRGRPQ